MATNFNFYDKRNLKSYNLDESMRYQLTMLDTLDVYTRKHSENVASLTCRLCEYLHCKKNFTEYCTICAYLHDIGKLHIPSSVLQKPGKLTDEEYEIMKKHTTYGYNICMKDLKLRPFAAGPLYHRESLNGTGYPNGVKKKDIPYEGQIIRVADEYDAIVSKRQYKSHIGISDTLKILIENVQNGKLNKKIVKALFKVVVDDIGYEITVTQNYVDDLQGELKRFSQMYDYKEKMQKAKSERKKNYYLEGIKMLLVNNETVDSIDDRYNEYKTAYETRKKMIDTLYDEIKIVKKLKV